jgi:hypothetical protein
MDYFKKILEKHRDGHRKKDTAVSVPIGHAVTNFFIAYAAVAKTKPESVKLSNAVKQGDDIHDVLGKPLHFNEKFPFSIARGAYALVVIEK